LTGIERSIGRYRWLTCGRMFAAMAINYVDRRIIGALKPTLQQEFGWNEIAFADIVFWFSARGRWATSVSAHSSTDSESGSATRPAW
jgi:hypothetical protein